MCTNKEPLLEQTYVAMTGLMSQCSQQNSNWQRCQLWWREAQETNVERNSCDTFNGSLRISADIIAWNVACLIGFRSLPVWRAGWAFVRRAVCRDDTSTSEAMPRAETWPALRRHFTALSRAASLYCFERVVRTVQGNPTPTAHRVLSSWWHPSEKKKICDNTHDNQWRGSINGGDSVAAATDEQLSSTVVGCPQWASTFCCSNHAPCKWSAASVKYETGAKVWL